MSHAVATLAGLLPRALPALAGKVIMTINEQSRHELHQRLEETLGPSAAATLMEHLPPVGWADVATKRDLELVQAATEHHIDGLRRDLDSCEHRIKADFRAELNAAVTSQTRTLMFALIGSQFTVIAAIFASASLR